MKGEVGVKKKSSIIITPAKMNRPKRSGVVSGYCIMGGAKRNGLPWPQRTQHMGNAGWRKKMIGSRGFKDRFLIG
jgi:hypothetical protein